MIFFPFDPRAVWTCDLIWINFGYDFQAKIENIASEGWKVDLMAISEMNKFLCTCVSANHKEADVGTHCGNFFFVPWGGDYNCSFLSEHMIARVLVELGEAYSNSMLFLFILKMGICITRYDDRIKINIQTWTIFKCLNSRYCLRHYWIEVERRQRFPLYWNANELSTRKMEKHLQSSKSN